MRVVGVGLVLAVVLGACATQTPPPAPPTTTSTSSLSPLADLAPKLDAIGVMLTTCIPRLQGEPVEPVDNCVRYMDDVAEVITEVEQQASKLPEEARTAIGTVRQALAEIEPCEPWFAAGGRTADGRLNIRCDQAWDKLFSSYTTVRKAA